MNDETTLQRLTRICVDVLGVEARDVIPERSFVADFGADSLDTIELLYACEDEFGISVIPEEKFERAGTVGQVVELIDRLKSAA